jgi:hypothetical protein
LFIDDGYERYLIEGTFEPGTEWQVAGNLSGSTILPDTAVPVEITAGSVTEHIRKVRDSLNP